MRATKVKGKQRKPQPASPALSTLQRELAALKKRVGQLEASFSKGGLLTCAGLNVVNANNESVATIDAKGQILCGALAVGRARKTAWALTFNALSGALQIWDRAGTVIASINDSGTGGIRLCMPDKFHTKSLIRLELNPGGGVVNLHDGKGKNVVEANAGGVGGSVRVESGDPQKGFATLEIDGSRSGQLVIVDREGDLSAGLP